LTSEFDPEVVRQLLLSQPRKPKASVQPTEADKRFQVFRFFLQAGWYDAAEKELEGIVTDYPKEQKRITDARQTLDKLRGLQLVDQIERASQAGRHKETRVLLAHFNRLKIDPELIAEKRYSKIQELRVKFNEDRENMERAREYLKAVPKRILHTDHRQIFTQAARMIEEGLNRDTVARLDGFIGLSRQEARDRKNRKRPKQTPEELMSLAVSGWLQGNDAAEPTVKTALQLLEARAFVRKYLRTPETGERDRLLTAYQRKPHIALDELTQMLRFLPPPEPASAKSIEEIRSNPYETQHASRDGSPGKGTPYYLQLPREYHHYRSYPVLIVLHSRDKPADEMFKHWRDLASQYGFILAAPEWDVGGAGYQYSEEEHAHVLDVLHDLRRRFQVDSDRVFLFGFAEGAQMALDVGLSHPDLFAGVMPMGAFIPKFYANHYWTNAQYLPFYFVDGSGNGDNPKKNRKQFGDWVRYHYPAMYVEYKGRGPEWFEGELPYLFDWMSCKKRAHPNRQLGKDGGGGLFGQEFRTMRASDNRFYWLTTDEIKPGFLNDKESWKVTRRPATLTARIGANNDIYVRTQGVKQVTLWFGPGMLNYEKPVTIRVNGGSPPWKRLVKPNLETLLKDVYDRGDRQRVYFAKAAFQWR
jgi:pimeloyl-ACP methyl ester carboxylesterase